MYQSREENGAVWEIKSTKTAVYKHKDNNMKTQSRRAQASLLNFMLLIERVLRNIMYQLKNKQHGRIRHE